MRNNVLQGEYHVNRLKRARALTSRGIVNTHQEYLDTIKSTPENTPVFAPIDYHHEVINDTFDAFNVHMALQTGQITADLDQL